MQHRKNNRTAGFSLIEVVVGIAVMGLVAAPVCASLLLSMRLNAHSQALMKAQLQVSGVVETLLAEGIEEGTAETSYTTGDGVQVELEEEAGYYDVVVTCAVGEEDVTVSTRVRAVEPPVTPPEEPDGGAEEGGETP